MSQPRKPKWGCKTWAGGLAHLQRAPAPPFPRGTHLPHPLCTPKHPWVHPYRHTELPSWTHKVGRAHHCPPETPGTGDTGLCTIPHRASLPVHRPGVRTPRVSNCFVTAKSPPNIQLSPQPGFSPRPCPALGDMCPAEKAQPPKTERNSQPGPKELTCPCRPNTWGQGHFPEVMGIPG